nr:hypothetical protein [Leptospira yasudae]
MQSNFLVPLQFGILSAFNCAKAAELARPVFPLLTPDVSVHAIPPVIHAFAIDQSVVEFATKPDQKGSAAACTGFVIEVIKPFASVVNTFVV